MAIIATATVAIITIVIIAAIGIESQTICPGNLLGQLETVIDRGVECVKIPLPSANLGSFSLRTTDCTRNRIC